MDFYLSITYSLLLYPYFYRYNGRNTVECKIMTIKRTVQTTSGQEVGKKMFGYSESTKVLVRQA